MGDSGARKAGRRDLHCTALAVVCMPGMPGMRSKRTFGSRDVGSCAAALAGTAFGALVREGGCTEAAMNGGRLRSKELGLTWIAIVGLLLMYVRIRCMEWVR